MKTTSMLAFVALAALASAPAAAHTVVYTTTLSGANESPANDSMGTGSSTVTIDFDTLMMHVQADFSGLTGTTTIAHIHCCTTEPFEGNVGVATPTPTFPGFPADVTSGSYDMTFDMSQASSYNAAFVTANGGDISAAFQALVDGMNTGRAYFNIHTTYRSGGEIRGFFTPVPVPAALPLLASALAGLGIAARRRAA